MTLSPTHVPALPNMISVALTIFLQPQDPFFFHFPPALFGPHTPFMLKIEQPHMSSSPFPWWCASICWQSHTGYFGLPLWKETPHLLPVTCLIFALLQIYTSTMIPPSCWERMSSFNTADSLSIVSPSLRTNMDWTTVKIEFFFWVFMFWDQARLRATLSCW